jgi:RNA polymerase sigma factor (sigma-70 family)
MEKELTDVERQTLMLYYGGPHTLVEIAQLTGTNPSTVSRNLRRGKKKLMSVLQYYLFD